MGTTSNGVSNGASNGASHSKERKKEVLVSTTVGNKTRGKIILKVKRPLSSSSKKLRKATKRRGLPNIQPRVTAKSFAALEPRPAHGGSEYDDITGDLIAKVDDDDDNDGDGDDELPSDTVLLIHSLQQGSQGLHIPLLRDGGVTIQALLESQLYQRFQDHHASNVSGDIRRLLHTNQVRQFSCQGRSTSKAYVWTSDYTTGVWDAHQQHLQSQESHQPAISWFVSALGQWTQSILSKSDLEQAWERDLIIRQGPPPRTAQTAGDQVCGMKRLSLDATIQYLLQIQVLLRETSKSYGNEECFVLWLPQWGTVLKSWNEARQQLLGYVARSKGGEVSLMNLVHENRHPSIATQFLLDELTQQGKIQVIERPFGKFVQRVP